MTLIVGKGKDPIPKLPTRPGRPSKLTREAAEAIFAAVRNHQRMEVAAELAGVDMVTFYGWLRTGGEAVMYLAKGGKRMDLTPHQRNCLDFQRSIRQEMARAEAIAIRGLVSPALSRQTRRKTVRKHVGLDDNNEPIYVTEETVYDDPPDTAPLKWYLERRVRGFQPRQQVELTGADGGPIEFEFVRKLNEVEQMIRDAQAEMAAEAIEAIAANSEEIE